MYLAKALVDSVECGNVAWYTDYRLDCQICPIATTASGLNSSVILGKLFFLSWKSRFGHFFPYVWFLANWYIPKIIGDMVLKCHHKFYSLNMRVFWSLCTKHSSARQCVQEDTHDRKVLIAIYPTHRRNQYFCILSKLLGRRKISTFWHLWNASLRISRLLAFS